MWSQALYLQYGIAGMALSALCVCLCGTGMQQCCGWSIAAPSLLWEWGFGCCCLYPEEMCAISSASLTWGRKNRVGNIACPGYWPLC